MKEYETIAGDYDTLCRKMSHNAKFVFEYAVALNATGRREKADSVLSRGLQVSCDALFYNVKGRKPHEIGRYAEAERCYINLTCLLPERIYAARAGLQPVCCLKSKKGNCVTPGRRDRN